MSPATFAAEKSNSPKLAEALAYKPANAPPAEVRRAARPQKGDLGRAIADRKIEVKVQLNRLAAKSPPLLPGQALAWWLLFPVRAHVDALATALTADRPTAKRPIPNAETQAKEVQEAAPRTRSTNSSLAREHRAGN
jgi:hypothetical protein